MIKKIYNKIANLRSQDRINLYQTLLANLLLLPIKEAVKFPILIYGKCRKKDMYTEGKKPHLLSLANL